MDKEFKKRVLKIKMMSHFSKEGITASKEKKSNCPRCNKQVHYSLNKILSNSLKYKHPTFSDIKQNDAKKED